MDFIGHPALLDDCFLNDIRDVSVKLLKRFGILKQPFQSRYIGIIAAGHRLL
jgi:hypothetical protein